MTTKKSAFAALGLSMMTQKESEDLAVALFDLVNKPEGNAFWAVQVKLRNSGAIVAEGVEFVKMQEALMLTGVTTQEQSVAAIKARRDAREKAESEGKK